MCGVRCLALQDDQSRKKLEGVELAKAHFVEKLRSFSEDLLLPSK